MSRTRSLTLVALWVAGSAVAWAIQWALTIRGLSILVIPLTFSMVLILMGAVLLSLAWPIRQLLKSATSKPPIDPLYAVRVLLLAKASALSGSLVGGVASGALLFGVTRPVIRAEPLWFSAAGFVGALVLMVSGLVVEKWCTLPPEGGSENGSVVPGGETA